MAEALRSTLLNAGKPLDRYEGLSAMPTLPGAPTSALSPVSLPKTTLGRIQQQLNTGLGPDGQPLTVEQKAQLQSQADKMDSAKAKLKSVIDKTGGEGVTSQDQALQLIATFGPNGLEEHGYNKEQVYAVAHPSKAPAPGMNAAGLEPTFNPAQLREQGFSEAQIAQLGADKGAKVNQAQANVNATATPTNTALHTLETALRIKSDTGDNGIGIAQTGKSDVFSALGISGYGALAQSLDQRAAEMKGSYDNYANLVQQEAGAMTDTYNSALQTYKATMDNYNSQAKIMADINAAATEQEARLKLAREADAAAAARDKANKEWQDKSMTPVFDPETKNLLGKYDRYGNWFPANGTNDDLPKANKIPYGGSGLDLLKDNKGRIVIGPTDKIPTHSGGEMDIVFGKGKQIPSFTGGTVISVRTGGKREVGSKSWGNYVQIKDENGFTSVYAHLDSTGLKVGDKISAGTIIGTEGDTGDTPGGAHLHYDVKNPGGKRVNSLGYITDYKLNENWATKGIKSTVEGAVAGSEAGSGVVGAVLGAVAGLAAGYLKIGQTPSNFAKPVTELDENGMPIAFDEKGIPLTEERKNIRSGIFSDAELANTRAGIVKKVEKMGYDENGNLTGQAFINLFDRDRQKGIENSTPLVDPVKRAYETDQIALVTKLNNDLQPYANGWNAVDRAYQANTGTISDTAMLVGYIELVTGKPAIRGPLVDMLKASGYIGDLEKAVKNSGQNYEQLDPAARQAIYDAAQKTYQYKMNSYQSDAQVILQQTALNGGRPEVVSLGIYSEDPETLNPNQPVPEGMMRVVTESGLADVEDNQVNREAAAIAGWIIK